MMAALIKRRERMARIYHLLSESYHGLLKAIFTCGSCKQEDYGVSLQSYQINKNMLRDKKDGRTEKYFT